jgi:protein-L-isoaspartate(D-aspartate) O-methyltransferase
MKNVRSLRRDSSPDETCWCAGGGWWLSTAPND